MIIRPGSTDDVPALAALERMLFGVDAWSQDALRAELTGADRFAAVAVRDAEVLGYLIARSSGDGVVDLHRFGVHPDHRRAGIARTVLASMADGVRPGARRILLEVSASNRAGVAFYTAEGFVEISRRPRYYRDGSDALVMERER